MAAMELTLTLTLTLTLYRFALHDAHTTFAHQCRLTKHIPGCYYYSTCPCSSRLGAQ